MLIIKNAKEKKSFTKKEAEEIGDKIGINWNQYSLKEFHMGMNVELEHGTIDPQTNVTDDDPVKTGKIALIHMKECATYYTRLAKMEKECK